MKADDVTQVLELQESRHYKIQPMHIAVIDSHLYTSLGKRLYDLYKKYSIESTEQREIESLCFLLTAFTIHREQPKAQSVWGRFLWPWKAQK